MMLRELVKVRGVDLIGETLLLVVVYPAAPPPPAPAVHDDTDLDTQLAPEAMR
jgi:hypothetical protein